MGFGIDLGRACLMAMLKEIKYSEFEYLAGRRKDEESRPSQVAMDKVMFGFCTLAKIRHIRICGAITQAESDYLTGLRFDLNDNERSPFGLRLFRAIVR